MDKSLKLMLAGMLVVIAIWFFVGGGDKTAIEYVEDYIDTSKVQIDTTAEFSDTIKIDTNGIDQ